MEGTFREWLADRVGDEAGKVSRRELARRLAAQDPTGGDPDAFRSSLGRILNGDRNPSQRTRDSIQRALGDWTAPRKADERNEPTYEEIVIGAREGIRHLRKLERWALARIEVAA